MIKTLLKGKPVLEIDCVGCGFLYESRYNRGQLKKYHREFGEYENHHTQPCPKCNTVMVINLNLKAEELEESFFNEVNMPEDERQQRRVIKEFMRTEIKLEGAD